ncbi:MAG: E3 binding domain-containing protein, partial [Anaerolineaceae bacterium]|nr:E3 binding domain-containing protein [Anaerolineaceae bacterium]
MAELVTMPKLGFDMAEGKLVRWVKAEGDTVAKGDVIAEIETDKATVEVESSLDGVMFRHLAPEEAELPVNSPIAVVSAAGEEPTDDEIDSLVVKAGGKPSKKVEKPAEAKKAEKSPSKEPESDESAGVSPAGGVRSSPLARKIAEEHAIQLAAVEGSGPQGRVVKKDVEAYLDNMSQVGSGSKTPGTGQTFQSASSFSMGEVPADEVVDLTRLRQAISRRMQDSNQNFPHFYLTRSYRTG